ncbi:hypothetical protein JXD38_03885 [candidate division WOR-3 bacterium]|nr:hypothetical protein [candidate division WOR-3 bacterium]
MKALFRLCYPFVLSLAVCWLTYDTYGHPARGIDDAQILFSYSSNLAAGRGFVYANNPEHVEGSTSLLWTLMCALPFRLGLNEPGVLAMSFVLLCLTQVLVVTLVRRLAAARRLPSWPFELVYLSLLLSCPSYFVWMSISLMDTCLWGFLILLMVYVVLSPPRSRAGVALAAVPFFFAPLSRPEAMIVAPAMIVLAWLRSAGGSESSHSHSRRRLVVPMVSFFVSALGITAFRLAYFGYPLPNTYYAKVFPSFGYNLAHGGEYLLGFALTSGPVVAGVAFFLLWSSLAVARRLFTSLRRGAHRGAGRGFAAWQIVACGAMVLLVVPVLSGGDHFVAYRFYQPALPVMLLAAILFAVDRSPHRMPDWRLVFRSLNHRLVAAVVLLGGSYLAYSAAYKPSWLDVQVSGRKLLQDQFEAAGIGIGKGLLLRDLFSDLPSYPAVGVIAAGGIARTYPGRIVDLMGLNTPSIAHHRGTRRGFHGHTAFERDAFFVLPRIELLDAAPPVPPMTENFASVALKELFADPRFFKTYRYGLLSLPGDEFGGFRAFCLVHFVDSLVRTGRYRFHETMRWTGQRWIEDSVSQGRTEFR